jgi:outer membrane biosynthesis protein TonB
MPTASLNAEGAWRRRAGYAVPAVLLAAAAWGVWTLAHLESGVRREAPLISTLIPVEEPPPPPPPKVRPPEPKPLEQTLPQPTPQPAQPTPQTPAPAQPTAGQNAVTENGPAQAGSDAFGLAAGNGSGGRGSGSGGGAFENAGMYGQYVKVAMTRAVRANAVLRGKAFRAEVRVWFDAQGKVTRVEFTRGSGVGAYDAEIRQALLALGGLRPPAAGALAQMPIAFAIDERPSL